MDRIDQEAPAFRGSNQKVGARPYFRKASVAKRPCENDRRPDARRWRGPCGTAAPSTYPL